MKTLSDRLSGSELIGVAARLGIIEGLLEQNLKRQAELLAQMSGETDKLLTHIQALEDE